VKKKKKRGNPETLFGAADIPKGGQAGNIPDGIGPAGLYGAFDKALETARESAALEDCNGRNRFSGHIQRYFLFK
jgi:hypothetical protein